MSEAPSGTGLTVRELSVRLPFAGRLYPVVDRVSFDIAPGEIVGLVGESGSGKTLAASALLGMVPGPGGRMQASELRLAGEDLGALDERGWRRVRGRDIAMIFQEPLSALDPVFTIGGLLVEVMRRHLGTPAREARDRAAALLADVGLADARQALSRYPHELSGGMRQRALVAMALSCEPRALVADEPTTALDVTTQAQILDLLSRRARASGTAVLLVTHDFAVVERVCDRALVMYAGRIVEEGPVSALLERPEHPYTAGLLAAMPRLASPVPEPVRPIPGQVPSPDRLPAGCSFSDRCRHADQRCGAEVPELAPLASDPQHRRACHHPLGGGTP